jgi:hypothetical protein
MRMQAETVALGSREWVVRPLTLRQVQEIEPILMDSALVARGNVAAALAIVAIGLRRDYPEVVDSLLDIEATASEIAIAMASVLRLGGFIESGHPGDHMPGEGVAGAAMSVDAPASISHTSTPV